MDSQFQTRDGRTVYTRLIRSDDVPLMLDLFDGLSPETRWRRFHTDLTHVSQELIERTARRLASVDNQTDGGAVMALTQNEGREVLVGVVRLGRDETNPRQAEVAIVVRDDYQDQGIGSHLLGEVVRLAQKMEIDTISAVMQADNEKLRRMLRWLKIPMVERTEGSRSEIVLKLK